MKYAIQSNQRGYNFMLPLLWRGTREPNNQSSSRTKHMNLFLWRRNYVLYSRYPSQHQPHNRNVVWSLKVPYFFCSAYIFVYSEGVSKFKYFLINGLKPQVAALCFPCKIKGIVHNDMKKKWSWKPRYLFWIFSAFHRLNIEYLQFYLMTHSSSHIMLIKN